MIWKFVIQYDYKCSSWLTISCLPDYLAVLVKILKVMGDGVAYKKTFKKVWKEKVNLLKIKFLWDPEDSFI